MPEDFKKRQRVLTDEDVAAIVEGFNAKQHCNLGLNVEEVARFKEILKEDLTPEQKGMLKRFLSAFDSAASIVGKTLLIAIVTVIIGLFTKGFWLTLIEKLAKH